MFTFFLDALKKYRAVEVWRIPHVDMAGRGGGVHILFSLSHTVLHMLTETITDYSRSSQNRSSWKYGQNPELTGGSPWFGSETIYTVHI